MRYILLTILILIALPFRAQAHQPVMSADTTARLEGATLIVRSADLRDRFLGSAVVFGPKGTAVTNAHVVGRAQYVDVITVTGQRLRAEVVLVDKSRDLAVLKSPDLDLASLTARSAVIHPGLPIYAIGAPLEAAFSLTAGIVSARSRQIDPTQPVAYIQHDAAVNPGSSGGALVDKNGHLVGLNTRISDGSRYFVGIAYAISVHDVLALLERTSLIKKDAPGFLVRPLDQRMRAALGYNDDGVLIETVHAGSPADRAGLLAGDILTAMDNRPVQRPGDIAFALSDGGDFITLHIRRANANLSLKMSLEANASSTVTQSSKPVERHTTYGLAQIGLQIDAAGQITRVAQQGSGFFSGLSVGDRILAINGQPVTKLGLDWQTHFRFDAPILVRIALPDGATKHYVLDPWDAGTGLRLASGANVLDQEVIGFD